MSGSSISNVKKENSLYEQDVPFLQKIILGFQHVLTMCPASLAVPLILGNALNLDSKTIAFLVSANLFTSGIAVLIQVIGIGKSIGSKLPIVLGSSFAPLGPMILIGEKEGLPVMFGAIIGSAILMFILSFFMDKILKLFPTAVVGSFVTLIGISLAPGAMKDLAGGEFSKSYGSTQSLLLGLFVLCVIILIGRFGKGIVKSLSLLIGMASGTIVGAFMGIVDFTPVLEAKWVQVITPFKFGVPKFQFGAIIIMTIFCIINMIQCIGVFSVLDEVTGNKTENDTKIKGIRAQTVSQAITGIFNSVPSTMFNENVGLLDLTKIKSRSVIRTAGIMLILLGIFPKFATIITIIPKPVLGGATLALFGVITSAGISILSNLDFSADNNFTVVGTSLAIGVGATFAPEIFKTLPQTLNMLFSNGLFTVSASAIILKLVLDHKG
ncbi:xanthine permease [Gottschalkia purinilytica]|uniref:Xanthine permease n=1 Tax=Gottschalkia purinilytica TaxID=1503 RepID=A0A0L0WAH9_GOTPU|nr:nucleobase:cation symporter-2 family protein [Gottschalkia purinilytica]KNF08514.1 xanthine permease [Gottschalkia purinilytica]